MLKVRLLCTMHDCDLGIDGPVLTEELMCDVNPNIKLGEPANVHTGYYLFDLSRSWCSKDSTGGKPPYEVECQDYWRVVIYDGTMVSGRKQTMVQ